MSCVDKYREASVQNGVLTDDMHPGIKTDDVEYIQCSCTMQALACQVIISTVRCTLCQSLKVQQNTYPTRVMYIMLS